MCYNGDLRTVEEVRAVEERFPQLTSMMIGRGAVADPALLRKLRGGPAATREELQAFTQDLYQSYQAFYGQVGTAAQRMREVWFYLIHLFADAERLNKRMRRFKAPGEYEAAEAAIFQELPLRDHSEGDLIMIYPEMDAVYQPPGKIYVGMYNEQELIQVVSDPERRDTWMAFLVIRGIESCG